MNPTRPTIKSSPKASDEGRCAGQSLPKLLLTDFLDLATLQEIQDSFASVTRFRTSICDSDGQPLTVPTDTARRAESDQVLDHLITADQDESGRFTAPIEVEGQRIGSLVIEQEPYDLPVAINQKQLLELVARFGLDLSAVKLLAKQAEDRYGPNQAAAVQFLHLLANSIARLCYEQHHALKRAEELSVLYRISTLLSAHRDLQQLLDIAVQSVAEAIMVKAASIRLIDHDSDLLLPRAVYNLSDRYLDKGIIEPDHEMLLETLEDRIVYVEQMAHDPRIHCPEDVVREGLVSMLCLGLVFQGKPVGTLQLFTGEVRTFTDFEVRLVRAIAQLLATAIRNARIDEQRAENEQLMRQLHLAADVQRRMLPGSLPACRPFDIAARYVPSLELGGDFYDFIDLDGNLGVAVGDVVGKGVAASLLMASVRSSLRAFAQDIYDLDEVIGRVNAALCRDTLDNEFATIWYGVFDPPARRLTYCNAGHEPPLWVRGGQIVPLEVGGMVVGIDPSQEYHKGLAVLEAGDTVFMYTDGLPDARNFKLDRFSRAKIVQVLLEATKRLTTAGEILNHILWEMRRFTGLHRSSDDMTMVVIKVCQ